MITFTDLDRVARRARGISKSMYHRLFGKHSGPKTILFIVGCQRSGTTLLMRILERDRRTSIYKEQSALSSQDGAKRLRLNPLPEVAAIIERNPAPVIVLKPLVESQNVLDLLDYFDSSRAVWLYRDFRDVAASYVRRWGSKSIDDLCFIVDEREGDWRYEKVAPRTMDFVRRHFALDMDPHDASALYWFVRNSFVPDLGLANDPRLSLCHYQDLVNDPDNELLKIYRLLGIDSPSARTTREVHAQSLGLGSHLELTPEINQACQQLLETLDNLLSAAEGES